MDGLNGLERKNEIKAMIQDQLMTRGIKDQGVLNAFEKVPRHFFVPEKFQAEAYQDHPIPIGEGQTISQPYMVAAMLELLELKRDEKVLEIGTGSGYQTALLAELVQEVDTIERIPSLYEKAFAQLRSLSYSNIQFKWGDGSLGWKENAPYQAIIVSAAVSQVPKSLLEQMAENGRLVFPKCDKSSQVLTRIMKKGNAFREETYFRCIFVPLIEGYGDQ